MKGTPMEEYVIPNIWKNKPGLYVCGCPDRWTLLASCHRK